MLCDNGGVAALHQILWSVGELSQRGEILFYSRGNKRSSSVLENRNLTS